MKRIILFLTIVLAAINLSYTQNRVVARGAEPGELYLSTYWYGICYAPCVYNTLRTAVYRITENGKKLTIQYDDDYFADCSMLGSIMRPSIFADATPGVLYISHACSKNGNTYIQLWVSFDYGRNWALREENTGPKYYFPHNVGGFVYRVGYDGFYKSENYGEDFYKMEAGKGFGEPGLVNEEVYSFNFDDFWQFQLLHTYNFFITYTENPIDPSYIYPQTYARFPDVYRGGKTGEVYIDAFFPWNNYKVSFSADTGHTFRHVYITDSYDPSHDSNIFGSNQLLFMSDREPGVFYILHLNQFADTNSYDWHLKLCIDYYRDYGETLVDTYCHDIHKNYENEVCEEINDLLSGKPTENSVLLTWNEPEEDLEIEGYRIYRNNALLNKDLFNNTSFLDENLSSGNYKYYVVTYYTNGCVSYPSNRVEEHIGVRIKEIEEMNKIVIYPNPASKMVTIDANNFTKVEVYNFVGQLIEINSSKTVNVSSYSSGIYFLKIFDTDNNIFTKRIVVLR